VRGGLLSLEEACSRYTLTVDEFLVWQRSIDRHGPAGLRSTRISVKAKLRSGDVLQTLWDFRNESGILLGNKDKCDVRLEVLRSMGGADIHLR
jgi:hypothetical protein